MTEEQWKKDRHEYWLSYELEAKEPTVRHAYNVYAVHPPKDEAKLTSFAPYQLYIGVSVLVGDAHIEGHSYWFGKRVSDMGFDEAREIWEFLIEHDLVEVQRLGPEDHEYMATRKLTDGS